MHVDHEREAKLPGAEEPMLLRRVLGVGGSHLISLRSVPAAD